MWNLINLQERGGVKLRIDLCTALERQRPGTPYKLSEVADLQALGLGNADFFAGPRSGILYQCVIDGQPTMLSDAGLDWAVIHRIHEVIHPNMPFQWNDYLAGECAKRNVGLQDMRDANWDRHADPWVPAPPHQLTNITIQELRALWEALEEEWGNAKNDALAFYNHVTWGGAVFVTSDNHFLGQKRRAALRQLTLHVNVRERQEDGNLHQHQRTLTFTTGSEILRPFDAVAYLCEQTGVHLENYRIRKLSS